jgi:hypothetical protein
MQDRLRAHLGTGRPGAAVASTMTTPNSSAAGPPVSGSMMAS